VNKFRLYNLFIELSATLLIFLFSYTAISKLLQLTIFRVTLAQSPFLKEFAGFVAVALPVAELCVVVLLLFPATRGRGLQFSFLLLTVLTIYLVCMVLFSPDLPCACGGVLKHMNWNEHIVFNLFFTLLALAGWQFDRASKLLIAISKQASPKT
jgi:hypothetical protein